MGATADAGAVPESEPEPPAAEPEPDPPPGPQPGDRGTERAAGRDAGRDASRDAGWLADRTSAPDVVIVMGVAGTGKTTVGALLAEALGVPYAEADAFHPPANVAKMSAGTPLDDADRAPWLDAIGGWARNREGRGGVVSCSALKRSYRDRLRAVAPAVSFLHLTGDRELIAERMSERAEHFMPLTLLDSQFADLEPLAPDEPGVSVPVATDPGTVTARALSALHAERARRAERERRAGQAQRLAGPEPASRLDPDLGPYPDPEHPQAVRQSP